jgi:hypothetical protein
MPPHPLDAEAGMETLIATGEVGNELRHCLPDARCCSGISLSQSRQNDARTSRVGIERLRALVQLR